MYDQIGQSMVREEATAFLEAQGHGTLCLAAENRGYGIPMSYGYDDENDRLVMELVCTDESKKRQFLQAAEEVTLTTYDHRDRETWASVVVTGTVHELPEEDVSERYAALFFNQAEDAAGELRWADLKTFDREWYELRIEELTGRYGGRMPTDG